MQNIKFPECIYLGEFVSKHTTFPAYVPAGKGGLCIQYNDDNEKFIYHQIQNIVLCLLEDIPEQYLKIHIFDFSNRPNFPFLSQLKNENITQVLLNEQSVINDFNELESIIQHRYHNLFNSTETHLDQYNERSPRPESYHVLIINTIYFPNNFISEQRLTNFLQSAFGAGVYVIVLHNENSFDDYQKNNLSLLSLINFLPNIELSPKNLIIDENILPVKKLQQQAFYFTSADVNQNQIINSIKGKFQDQHKNTDTDFLSVKIGTHADGSDAYLRLGEASMNYHALLLGISGSGKSTLMNNIIMNIAEQYDANQIRLYLMDYKMGVEFNKFQNHPNVEKIFLKSRDIQAGIAMLEDIQQNIYERYELFKSSNVEKISEYNIKNSEHPLPHIILMIDEFHKLMQGDYQHNERVNLLLEDVAKLGRATGIHLFLCTQSLKDVNLHSSLKDQIGLRITYRVINDTALGYDIFNSKHNATILSLQKYQVFIQLDSYNGYTAFVDKPQDIDNSIKRIRLSRPSHLQVQAEIMQSDNTANPTLQRNTGNTSPEKNNGISKDVIDISTMTIDNPNQQNFNELDTMLSQTIAKLRTTQQEPSIADDDTDEIDWLKDVVGDRDA